MKDEETRSSRYAVITDLHTAQDKWEMERAVWDHVYQGLAFLGNGNGDADSADVVFNDPEDAQRAVNGLTEDGWSISFATLAEEESLEQRCLHVSNIHFRADLDCVKEDFLSDDDYEGYCTVAACHNPAAADCFMENYHDQFFHGRRLRVHPA